MKSRDKEEEGREGNKEERAGAYEEELLSVDVDKVVLGGGDEGRNVLRTIGSEKGRRKGQRREGGGGMREMSTYCVYSMCYHFLPSFPPSIPLSLPPSLTSLSGYLFTSSQKKSQTARGVTLRQCFSMRTSL